VGLNSVFSSISSAWFCLDTCPVASQSLRSSYRRVREEPYLS
jgi:hypothetical protein